MKKRLAWLAAVVLMLGLSVDHPLRAFTTDDDDAGWTKTEQTFDLDILVFNTCNNDEIVHILGEGLISVMTRTLSDGTVEIKEKDRFRGNGVGTSGAQYRFDEKAQINQSIGPNPDGTPFSYMEYRTQQLRGAGGIPNQLITYDIRLVIDGAGNVTVDIFDVQIECDTNP